jgi:hypothetical protein
MGEGVDREVIARLTGWTSVEDLVRGGFAQTPIVTANEAHDGLARCVRTRQVGVRIVKAAHELGVRRLAMEALPWPGDGTAGPIRQLPSVDAGYLAQPDMQELIMTALDLGWTLWAYEAAIEPVAEINPADLVSLEFTNWREREQARNLCNLVSAAPRVPLLIWCGNGHATKQPVDDWTPMGCHFTAISRIEPFVIDQTVSVDWPEHSPPWLPELLASLGDTLHNFDGTAGILRPQAPAPWNALTGVDAVIVSTHNQLA